MRNFFSFLAFQAGWLACVGGAAEGRPWLGPIVVLALAAGQWALAGRPRSMLLLMGGAAVLGYVADSALALCGLLAFPPGARLGAPSPMWMVALWMNFAATLGVSLKWLQSRPFIGTLLGAVGGPLAYWAGQDLGALRIAGWPGLAAVAVVWAAATPLLLGGLRWLREGESR